MANSNKHGYWWGEKVVIEDESETEEPQYPVPAPNPKLEDLMKMHPSQLKQLEEDYRVYAVWQRTSQANKDYWTVVDAARRVARAFTAQSAVTMLQNPQLNARAQNPITNAGRKVKRQTRDNEVNNGLLKAKDQFALVMFTQPSCQYCQLQRNSLKFFADKHQWSIGEVDITRKPEVAARFNVQITPVTIVIQKGSEKWMNIAVGAESTPNIEDNAFRAVRLLQGKITPQQFYTAESMQGGFFDPQPQGSDHD